MIAAGDYREYPNKVLRDGCHMFRDIKGTEDYVLEYLYRNNGFVPSNYAIGTREVTA